MPVGIQETQAGDARVVDPSQPAEWILAKTAVQVADLVWHEARAHLGLTHLVMEGVTLATQRQLSERHPLHVCSRRTAASPWPSTTSPSTT
jgi:hypothetical protein